MVRRPLGPTAETTTIRRWCCGKGALTINTRSNNDPSLGQHDEAVAVAAAHDLEHPRPRSGHGGLHLAALVTGIADDAFQEREGASRLAQQGLCAVPVLDARRMNDDAEEEPERIRQNVALAACNLLARVIAGRVE